MRKRSVAISIGSIAALAVLLPMSWAWACTSLATLDLKPAAGNSGQTVQGEGFGFTGAKNPHRGSVDPVEVRWNSMDGPVLAKVTPDPSGNIRFNFVAPEGAPGYYTVIAIQNRPDGRPVEGTPARATFALNNPPPQAVSGAELANSRTTRTPGQAPSAVVEHHAGAGQAPQSVAPALVSPQRVPLTAKPADARSRNVLGGGAGRGALETAGLTVAMVGGVSLVAAMAAASTMRSRRPARARR